MTINRQTNDYSQRYGVKRKRTREANGREKRKGKKKIKCPKKAGKKANEGIKQQEASPLIVRLHIPVNCVFLVSNHSAELIVILKKLLD